MYEYRVVETTAEDGSPIYGLALYINGRQLCALPHLSADRQRMEQIAALCTKEQVEPIHMQDVAYDMLH